MVDAGSGQDVLSKSLDVVKARVSLAKTGQHVAGALRLSTLEFLEMYLHPCQIHLRPGSSLKDRKPVEDS